MRPTRLVYSTQAGRAPAPAPKSAGASAPPADGIVRIFRERAGRAGKTVTVIRGLSGPAARLDELAAELRRLCSSGGAVKAGVIEIQGDHRERVAERLRAVGYAVKLAGG